MMIVTTGGMNQPPLTSACGVSPVNSTYAKVTHRGGQDATDDGEDRDGERDDLLGQN